MSKRFDDKEEMRNGRRERKPMTEDAPTTGKLTALMLYKQRRKAS